MAFAKDNPSCGIWGGRTLFANGSLNPFSCWREMSLWTLGCYALGLSYIAPNNPLFNPEPYAGWDRSTVRHVDIVTGCLFLIDRQLWTALGGFNSAFFMYAEEADLCHRARKAGARPTITPDATICHYGRAVEGTSVAQRLKLFKGKATLMRLHWSPLRRWMGEALFLLAVLLRWWTYRMLARVTGKPKFSWQADDWKTIWRQRADWIKGYTREQIPIT